MWGVDDASRLPGARQKRLTKTDDRLEDEEKKSKKAYRQLQFLLANFERREAADVKLGLGCAAVAALRARAPCEDLDDTWVVPNASIAVVNPPYVFVAGFATFLAASEAPASRHTVSGALLALALAPFFFLAAAAAAAFFFSASAMLSTWPMHTSQLLPHDLASQDSPRYRSSCACRHTVAEMAYSVIELRSEYCVWAYFLFPPASTPKSYQVHDPRRIPLSIEQDALAPDPVAAAPTRLLVVPLEALGHRGVNHVSDMWMIDSHAKRDGRRHHLDLATLPVVLDGCPLPRRHPCMVMRCWNPSNTVQHA